MCSIYNGNCIEKHKYISDYRGDAQSYCKSIVPSSTYKCVYDTNVGWMKKLKGHSEASGLEEYAAISSEITKADEDTKCSYISGKCI